MREREMARSRAARKARLRKQRNRRVVLTVCLMLAVCVASIGGTLAWLQDSSVNIVNTFTPSNIDIGLTETKSDFKMVPGVEIEKDPKVTVEAGSEKSWVFVTVTETDATYPTGETTSAAYDFSAFITYNMAAGWKELTSAASTSTNTSTKVYYRIVEKSNTDADIPVIGYNKVDGTTPTFVPNKVLTKTDVTKEMMDNLEKTGATKPALTFQAYAIQYAGFEVGTGDSAEQTAALAAWNQAKTTT